ncbi:MAG: PIN domain-containing protein [Dokdonella sp.]
MSGGTISGQVLKEKSNVALRKLGVMWSEVRILLEPVRALCRIEPLTEAAYDLGRLLPVRYRFSVDDAIIAASAQLAEADTLYSEDMHDGLLVEERLRIRNPFRARTVLETRAARGKTAK